MYPRYYGLGLCILAVILVVASILESYKSTGHGSIVAPTRSNWNAQSGLLPADTTIQDGLASQPPKVQHQEMYVEAAKKGTLVTLQGNLSVGIACGKGYEHTVQRIFITNEGKQYDLVTWGQGLNQVSRKKITVTGYIDGNHLLVEPNYALLGTGESHILESTSQLQQQLGNIKVLVIRVRFANEATSYEPIIGPTLQEGVRDTVTFYRNASYGKAVIVPTIIPNVVALSLPAVRYAYNGRDMSYLETIRQEAGNIVKASNSNWDIAQYDVTVIVTSAQASYSTFAGLAEVGGNKVHLVGPYFGMPSLSHELGHTLGLFHANCWSTDAVLPYGRKSTGGINSEIEEYGHPFDVMANSNASVSASKNPIMPHFAAKVKMHLGWLEQKDVQLVDSSGVYRIYAQDKMTTGVRALKIQRICGDIAGGGRMLWLSYRANYSEPPFHASAGIQADWCTDRYGDKENAVQFVDLTPYSQYYLQQVSESTGGQADFDKLDGVLVPGATFADDESKIYVTTLNVNANEGYADVRLELAPRNNRPTATMQVSKDTVAIGEAVTLSIVGTDSDNDQLYYNWRFGFGREVTLGVGGSQTAITTRTWQVPGIYTVTGTVSDGKSMPVTYHKLITVGNPLAVGRTKSGIVTGVGAITGRVLKDELPVRNARVTASRAVSGTTEIVVPYNPKVFVHTDEDGYFAISQLYPATYTLTATVDGATLVSKFTNPITVAVGGVASGKDFWVTACNIPLTVELAPANMVEYRSKVGQTFLFQVTGAAEGKVWGTDIYADDSSLSCAAVHAGLISPYETDLVAVTILSGQLTYGASTRNGVPSQACSAWEGSFTVAGSEGISGTLPTVVSCTKPRSFVAGEPVVLAVSSGGQGPFSYQWYRNNAVLQGATGPIYISSANQASAGNYSVRVTNSFGTSNVNIGSIAVITNGAPVIQVNPQAKTVSLGSRVSLTVIAKGNILNYQWKKSNSVISGATRDTLDLYIAASSGGSYSCTVSNSAGSINSDAALVTISPSAVRMANISCRTKLPLNGVVTPGFYIEGQGSKRVLIRAIGPGLRQFGLVDVVSDPRFEVINQNTNTVIAGNDNAEVSEGVTSQAGAFPISRGSLDAALVVVLTAGQGYSVQVKGNSSGVVLLEIYDLDSTGLSKLTNVSVRGNVGTGDDVLVLGLGMNGQTKSNLLIRGVGPGLELFGVSQCLQDPVLEVFTSQGRLLATNNDWETNPVYAEVVRGTASTGAFPLQSGGLDAATITSVSPGAYTVVIRGAQGTGEALVEVYEIP